MSSTERIAIVSFAGRFPGAGPDLDRFWANVAGAVDCSREVPPGRWLLPPERCRDPRVANPTRSTPPAATTSTRSSRT